MIVTGQWFRRYEKKGEWKQTIETHESYTEADKFQKDVLSTGSGGITYELKNSFYKNGSSFHI